MKEVIIATKNQGKTKEFKDLFSVYGITVKSLLDLDVNIPDVEETGDTFRENARIKAETIAKELGKTVFADDSGLVVDILDGRPGVYSARFAGEPKDDTRNNEKLLVELGDSNQRSAHFVCVLACANPNEKTLFSHGICEGKIARELLGENGFGYDPLFIPNGYDQTMAQLSADEKNTISHRYDALQKMEQTLLQNKLLGGKNESGIDFK